jgi:ABC-type branched-subunit amino acid transport system substrate-binding protein
MVAGDPSARRAAATAGRTRHRFAAIAVLLGLISTAACGARWTDAQRASVLARSQAGASATGSGSGTGSTGSSAATSTTLAGAVGGGQVATTGGAVGSSTGTGAQGAAAGAGALPCAAASSATGVTNTTITVGNIATVSGPVPGLGESSVAAVQAYVAYRNATGGVCGRQIALKTGDDGAENGRFRTLVTDLSANSLGLAGGFAAGDGGGVDVVAANHLPVVGNAFSGPFQTAPTVFNINPAPADLHAAIGKYRYLYAQGVRTASLITLATAQSDLQLNQQQTQMEAVGIKVVNRQELPLSTLSFDAPARAVANSKADYLLFVGAGNLNSSMARSMSDSGYKPKFSEYLTAYGSTFIQLAGATAAEGVTSWTRTLPNEEAGSNPEQTAFLQWMARIAPGIAPDTFAADAWASAKAFFDALSGLRGPISRDGLIAQLHSMTNYDAGGFLGPIDLGDKRSHSCYVAMKVVSAKWQRLTPDHGFLC